MRKAWRWLLQPPGLKHRQGLFPGQALITHAPDPGLDPCAFEQPCFSLLRIHAFRQVSRLSSFPLQMTCQRRI